MLRFATQYGYHMTDIFNLDPILKGGIKRSYSEGWGLHETTKKYYPEKSCINRKN